MTGRKDTLLKAFSFWLFAGLFLLPTFSKTVHAQDLQGYTPPPMFGGAPVSRPAPVEAPKAEAPPPPAPKAVPVEPVKPEPVIAPQPEPKPIEEPKEVNVPERKPEPSVAPAQKSTAAPIAPPVKEPEPVQDIDAIEHAPPNEPILEGVKAEQMPSRPKHLGEPEAMIFERGQTTLEQEQINFLEQKLLPRLKAETGTRLRIVAFATPAGDEGSSDRRISLSRAMNIRDFLKNAGIPTSRITLNAFGSATDKSPIDRVDLIFLAQ